MALSLRLQLMTKLLGYPVLKKKISNVQGVSPESENTKRALSPLDGRPWLRGSKEKDDVCESRDHILG